TFHRKSVFFHFLVTKEICCSTSRNDQVVVIEYPDRCMYFFFLVVDMLYFGQTKFKIHLGLEHFTKGKGNGIFGQCACRNLIHKWLEGVEVVSVNKKHLYIFIF